MKRRTLLATGSVALFGGVAGAVVGFEPPSAEDTSRAEYQGEERVVSDHPDLKLWAGSESVRLGETIEFVVTNTGASDVNLGCKNPWAIQRYTDGEWRQVTWTGSQYYQLCLTKLSPDETITETVTLSKAGLERQASEVQGELRLGTYRFVILGSSPYLAVTFDVVESGSEAGSE